MCQFDCRFKTINSMFMPPQCNMTGTFSIKLLTWYIWYHLVSHHNLPVSKNVQKLEEAQVKLQAIATANMAMNPRLKILKTGKQSYSWSF